MCTAHPGVAVHLIQSSDDLQCVEVRNVTCACYSFSSLLGG